MLLNNHCQCHHGGLAVPITVTLSLAPPNKHL